MARHQLPTPSCCVLPTYVQAYNALPFDSIRNPRVAGILRPCMRYTRLFACALGSITSARTSRQTFAVRATHVASGVVIFYPGSYSRDKKRWSSTTLALIREVFFSAKCTSGRLFYKN